MPQLPKQRKRVFNMLYGTALLSLWLETWKHFALSSLPALPCWQVVSDTLSRNRFTVINQRFNIAFYYFSNIKTTNGSVPAYTSAGVIAAATVVNGIANQPTQGHLTFSGVPGCAARILTSSLP